MKNIGLTERVSQEAKEYPNLFLGRISSQHKNFYTVITEKGEISAEISGKFHYHVKDSSGFPAVGDFVMLDRLDSDGGNAIIHHVLSRKSVFGRKVAGTKEDMQVIAANIDTVFICMSLNNDFNLRRLERYLAVAWDSGATPVVILTKSDLCFDIDKRLSEVTSVSVGVDVYVTSSSLNEGFESLTNYFTNGKTVAFIGSSGVGKSTLINRLIGKEVMETSGLRNDDKGRHTTTSRELIRLPDSGVVIDTPGMRELGIISADFSRSFSDIDELARECKFNDCRHTSEPKCAVQKAIQDGTLSVERLNSYRKLLKEAKYDGLNSRMIEKEKLNTIFSEVGGMKNARKTLQEKKKNQNYSK